MLNVVGLSGGKDSTCLAFMLHDMEPQKEWTYICTPTGDESPEMVDHWLRLEQALGRQIIRITHKNRTLDDVIQLNGMLPNFRARFCTRQLKIEPTVAWCVKNHPVLMHVGLRADEDEREGIYGDLVKSRFPFREWGFSLKEVLEYCESLKEQYGIVIPRRTDCLKCYHQRIGEWRDFWVNHPERYQLAVEQEQRMGHTFRSPGRDTWPVDLAGLRAAFESGRPIRGDKKNGSICRVCSL